MKTNSKKAKELIAALTALSIGQAMTFPSPLPGIDKADAQGFLRETQENFWVLELRWNGIMFAEVTAQIMDDNLLLEVL